jgi:NCS1 family nucleobase:cation symporter-1
MIFWGMNVYFILKGTESIRWLESLAAPFLLTVGLGLLTWAYTEVGSFGPILNQPSKFQTMGEFWRFFMPSLTGMVGFWATLSLNIPDFTRYAQSQQSQIIGQAIGLPPTMALFSFIGVAVTSATVVVFGLVVATLTTNIAANVVSPANDFANLWPRKIGFKTGGLITAILGIAMMPWKLLEDYGTYIFGWLVGYSSFLGPIAGVLIADYFIARKKILNVKDLYVRGGEYEYSKGFNPKALVALAAGVVVALVGLVVPELRFLYDYAWFVGFAVAFGIHVALMK